jgi:D-threo-aldose 1-dehydrogenase
MKRVTLPGTDLTTSELGFGSTGGRISDRERLRLYQVALDHGITHFDTARAYGVGGAEGVLGRFLAGRRDQVTVTTKLGILPPSSGAFLRVARLAARTAERLLPSTGARAKQVAARRLLTGKRFSLDDARTSFETSLRELGTDHVDILLLHECAPDDVQEDLLDFLDERVQAGQVRFTGIATGVESTAAITRRDAAFPAIVQVANSATEPSLERLSLAGRATITHSPFSTGLAPLRAALSTLPDLAQRWTRELQADISDLRTLSNLMLSYALRANRGGVVLFFSRRTEHIAANAADASGSPAFSDDRLAAFARLVREHRLS